MFKLDKKQTVALTLSVLVGIIIEVVVGYVIAPIVSVRNTKGVELGNL